MTDHDDSSKTTTAPEPSAPALDVDTPGARSGPLPPQGAFTGPPLNLRISRVMRKLCPTATRVFLHLVEGLDAGGARTIDNAAGAFMAVSVDCLRRARVNDEAGDVAAVYAVAHRFESNGDLVPDPDVEFLVVQDPLGSAVYPTAIDHPPPFGYRRYVEFGSDGLPDAINRRGQADLAAFCDAWMRNIRQQQGLVLQ
jgi:hypothetical protein